MLRVTIEIVPGGQESAKRTLAVAEIGNIGGDSLGHYHVEVSDEAPGLKEANVDSYPRWSASVWNLVLRCVAKAMYGKEQLPERPTLVSKLVPIYDDGGLYPYIKQSEIPEPARTEFGRRTTGFTVPLPGHAYLQDWLDFLRGRW